MSVRTWCAVAAVPVAAAVLLASAAPAWAKSDIALSVSARTVHVGHSVRVSASGDDDGTEYSVICVQKAVGKHWQDLRCSRPSDGSDEAFSLHETHVGTQRLRAALYATDKAGHRQFLDRVSGTDTVRVIR